jgi:hypothetical protein
MEEICCKEDKTQKKRYTFTVLSYNPGGGAFLADEPFPGSLFIIQGLRPAKIKTSLICRRVGKQANLPFYRLAKKDADFYGEYITYIGKNVKIAKGQFQQFYF